MYIYICIYVYIYIYIMVRGPVSLHAAFNSLRKISPQMPVDGDSQVLSILVAGIYMSFSEVSVA